MTQNKHDISAVTLNAMQMRADELKSMVVRTPVVPLQSSLISRILDDGTLYLKLECFQHTGTFKARGALSVARSIPIAKNPKE